ncbi:hypothetical protein GCM10025787_17540 [Saccharopolyspora rosea]|uniref:Uncharacterized protein n=1 Tax=Saccharopolyspora rosea TaxID=524884 RepID=A0ABW3FYQ3_9PSEU
MTTDDRKETATPADRPAADPVGTVRIHPDDAPDDPAARRAVKTSGGWTMLTRPESSAPGAPCPAGVGDWPRQPLGHLAAVLGHPDGVDARPRPALRRHPAGLDHQPHSRAPARAPAEPVVPSFWEEAKLYCRACRNATALLEYWYDRYRELADDLNPAAARDVPQWTDTVD